MLNKTIIEFSIYKGSTTMESFILDYFNISKSQLKKYKLPKKFLSKEASQKTKIEIDINIVNRGLIKTSSKHGINILYEDDNVLCFSKKQNLHSHPLNYNEVDNCLSELFYLRPELKRVNQFNYDRGLLYRLDFETSGLLIYLKKNSLYENYRKNFKSILKKKVYLAIIEGSLEGKLLLHDKITQSGKKMTTNEVSGADANIEVHTIQTVANKTLVKVYLNEGLRHQIRVQLSNAGFPILGDELYGGNAADRLYLHCYEYQLNDQVFKDKSCYLFDNFFNFDC